MTTRQIFDKLLKQKHFPGTGRFRTFAALYFLATQHARSDDSETLKLVIEAYKRVNKNMQGKIKYLRKTY